MGVKIQYGPEGLAAAAKDPDSVHIVYPAGASGMLTQECLDSDDNKRAANRARNVVLSAAAREYAERVTREKNIPGDHRKALEDLVLAGFVGDHREFESFAGAEPFQLSSVDKTAPFELRAVYERHERLFAPGFFPELMSTMLIGYPIMGPGELFLCALTDYRRPLTPVGDLVGDRGSAEVKAEGRLGGQKPDRDGLQSRRAVFGAIGIPDDGGKAWGPGTYRTVQEALREARVGRRMGRKVVGLMMNYDVTVTPDMVDAVTSKGCDLSRLHAALHLHCYSSRRGFGEVLFLSKDRRWIVAYEGRTFGQAMEFAGRLRNRGGWGAWNQDRSGVQVEFT